MLDTGSSAITRSACSQLLQLSPRDRVLAHSTTFFYAILTGTEYGSSRLESVPAAPGTNDNYSGGGPQRGYTGSSSSSNNYHPYRR